MCLECAVYTFRVTVIAQQELLGGLTYARGARVAARRRRRRRWWKWQSGEGGNGDDVAAGSVSWYARGRMLRVRVVLCTAAMAVQSIHAENEIYTAKCLSHSQIRHCCPVMLSPSSILALAARLLAALPPPDGAEQYAPSLSPLSPPAPPKTALSTPVFIAAFSELCLLTWVFFR